MLMTKSVRLLSELWWSGLDGKLTAGSKGVVASAIFRGIIDDRGCQGCRVRGTEGSGRLRNLSGLEAVGTYILSSMVDALSYDGG